MADSIELEPGVAANYDALVEAGSHTYDGIADMAENSNPPSPSLAKWARDRAKDRSKAAKERREAAGRGEAIVSTDQQTRSKGKNKPRDGQEEPPKSIDKNTPGTRFPDVPQGDKQPVTVASADDDVHEVSQTPSSVVDQQQRHPEQSAPTKRSSGAVKAAPSEVPADQDADAAQPKILDEPVDPSADADK